MGTVPIEHLSTGMILKSDVCDRSGRMLLPAGAELTEKHLQIFRTWGVLEADIVGGGGCDAGALGTDELDPAVLERAEAMVKPIFMHNDTGHPAIKELLRICIARKAAHVS